MKLGLRTIAASAALACASFSTSAAVANGTITWATDLVIATNFDPHKVGPGTWLTNLYPAYDTLISADHTSGDFHPRLALEWKQIPDDGWEFKLRENVRFQDGAPFNAEAVKLNIERAQTMKDVLRTNTREAAKSIGKIEVVDEHTIRLYRNPDASLIGWALLETHMTQNLGMMISPAAFDNADLDRRPVGAGPFMVTNFIGDTVTFEPYPDYWDRSAITLEKIVITNEGDMEADYSGVASGQYNIVGLLSGQVDKARGLTGVDLHEKTSLNIAYYSFNEDLPPLNDVRVRQALNYAIDREGIVQAAVGGAAVPTTQRFPPDYKAFAPEFGLDHYRYDPEKARALLAEAGFADGMELTFQTEQGGDERIRVAEAIEQLMANVGVTIKTVIRSPADPNLFHSGKAHAVNGLGSKLNPLQQMADYYDEKGFLNPAGIKDEKTQELINTAATYPSNSPERWDLVRQISAHTADQAFAMPLYAVKIGRAHV